MVSDDCSINYLSCNLNKLHDNNTHLLQKVSSPSVAIKCKQSSTVLFPSKLSLGEGDRQSLPSIAAGEDEVEDDRCFGLRRRKREMQASPPYSSSSIEMRFVPTHMYWLLLLIMLLAKDQWCKSRQIAVLCGDCIRHRHMVVLLLLLIFDIVHSRFWILFGDLPVVHLQVWYLYTRSEDLLYHCLSLPR